jgi:hypothetical protein
MPDYEPGPSRPDLAEKVAALRGGGLSVTVWRTESQITRQNGSAYPPSWACMVESSAGRIATGEGTDEHEAFKDAYRQLPELPV